MPFAIRFYRGAFHGQRKQLIGVSKVSVLGALGVTGFGVSTSIKSGAPPYT